MVGLVLTAVGASWLVAATFVDGRSRHLAKPLASAGFLLVVLLEPLDDTARAGLVVAGLVCGAVGDMVLMGRGDGALLAGLGAFLVGHGAYVAAFSFDQGELGVRVLGAVAAMALGAGSLAWLNPRMRGPFRVAVPVYAVVICAMTALAIGAAGTHPAAGVGAVLFALSDLFVARERFVAPSRWNPVVGLPLYYAGQVLIAVSAVELT